MNPVLIVLGIVGGVFGVAYVFLMTRHKERIALIEKGADASIFSENKVSALSTLKFGMLFVGIAIGILVGNVLYENLNLPEGVAYMSMIFMLGGISLIVNFFIERKLQG